MADQTDQGVQPEASPPPPPSEIQSYTVGPTHAGAFSLAATPPATAPAEKPSAILERLDIILVMLLLALAFLVGSFAATNSDVWLHLASGRHIAQGEWTIGVDPFSFATLATPTRPAIGWVQHSWLYSWLFYLLYNLVGGGGLVVLKALAVVLLAWCLLRIPGGARDRFLAVIYVGLAVLAISPQLVLRPMTVSFLLFAVTSFVCYRAGVLGNVPPNPRVLWRLPLLFLLWANLDVWFIMGPLTLALLWAGSGVGVFLGIPRSFPGKTLGAVLGVGLLACVVNPHHVQVFMLPPELANLIVHVAPLPDWLGAGGRALRNLQLADPDYYPLLSPLSPRYWGNASPGGGRNIGALAYVPLLLLGLSSFVVNSVVTKKPGAPGLHPGRFVLWVFLAFLSLLQARLIPWFAIASAPITLLNLVDWRTWLYNIQVPNLRPALLGRALTICLFLLLLFLAWPGWLYAPVGDFTSARHVAWKMPIDPSYHAAALRLAEMSNGGQAANPQRANPEGLRVFNFSPDIAHYCAWYAPGVRCFLDSRWSLFPADAAQAAKTRMGLAVNEPEAWQKTFLDRKVDYLALVIANFKRAREAEVAARLWLDDAHWLQKYADGWTLVFAWSPDKMFAGDFRAELARKAFGKVPGGERAPAKGPALPEEEPSLWSLYRDSPEPLPLAFYEANLWSFHYQQNSAFPWRGLYPALSQLARAAEPAGLGICSVTVPYLVGTVITLKLNNVSVTPSRNAFVKTRDFGPPAAPLLMIRSARRAALENPHDSRVYLLLFDANTALLGQEEHWANYAGRLPPGRRLAMRQMQRMTALQTYLVLKPDEPNINDTVGKLFLQMKWYDVALEHLRRAAEHIDQFRPSAGNPQDLELFKKKKGELEKLVHALEDEVKKRKDDYEKEAAFTSKKGLEKYPLAIDRGLAKEAVDLLTNLKAEGLEPREKTAREVWLINLLLRMGRANYLEGSMISPELVEFRAFHAAVLGNYLDADKAFGDMEKNFTDTRVRWLPEATALHAAALAAPGLSGEGPAALSVHVSSFHFRQQDTFRRLALPEAELRTLRGILALEYGATAAARKHLEAALELAGPDVYFQDRAIAERYLELLRDANK